MPSSRGGMRVFRAQLQLQEFISLAVTVVVDRDSVPCAAATDGLTYVHYLFYKRASRSRKGASYPRMGEERAPRLAMGYAGAARPQQGAGPKRVSSRSTGSGAPQNAEEDGGGWTW